MLVVTNTEAFGATLVVPLAGLTVTAAARWADKLAVDLVAALVAVLKPLCPMPQAETVIAAMITAAPTAPTRLTVRQYAHQALLQTTLCRRWRSREQVLGAHKPGCIEEHGRICVIEPKVECGVIVAVETPLVASDEVVFGFHATRPQMVRPKRFPKEDIEMDNGKPLELLRRCGTRAERPYAGIGR